MWWKKKKEPEDWRLVKTIKYPNGISTGKKDTPKYQTGDLYFHLFESNEGNRCFQLRCTITNGPDYDRLVEFAKSTDLYNTQLYRWLHGRSDPEILRYSEVDQEETMHELKGTIKETPVGKSDETLK